MEDTLTHPLGRLTAPVPRHQPSVLVDKSLSFAANTSALTTEQANGAPRTNSCSITEQGSSDQIRRLHSHGDPTLIPKKTLRKARIPYHELSHEDSLLVYLKHDENLPWVDIAARFCVETGRTVQVATLQMRYKRLHEKFRIWEEEDVHALRLAHEYWDKYRWEIISSKMLDFNIQERWPARYCSRKWQELESFASEQQRSWTPDTSSIPINNGEELKRRETRCATSQHSLQLREIDRDQLESLRNQNQALRDERDSLRDLLEHVSPSLVGKPGMPNPMPRPTSFEPLSGKDDILLAALGERQLDWKQIADFFPGQSWNALRTRWVAVCGRGDNGCAGHANRAVTATDPESGRDTIGTHRSYQPTASQNSRTGSFSHIQDSTEIENTSPDRRSTPLHTRSPDQGACGACREIHVKCDGKRPVCGNCIARERCCEADNSRAVDDTSGPVSRRTECNDAQSVSNGDPSQNTAISTRVSTSTERETRPSDPLQSHGRSEAASQRTTDEDWELL